ncbi:MAG: hypothetical protein CMF80_06980 [Candidatus Marinimicrobia bacterium]|nr:hypothetical protein [Candidatus Neomarinimicrobiota bacterium]|tara:strand:- start:1576 stop:1944 length:369 start_codon:yes stop_codon:yes gene_type:complete
MTSTRNKNTYGNYELEQEEFRRFQDYNLNTEYSYGKPYLPAIPSGGSAPPSKINRTMLSSNSVDIESALRGIGSTNLVNPKFPTFPKLTPLKQVEFFKKPGMVLPADLEISTKERPFPNINS